MLFRIGILMVLAVWVGVGHSSGAPASAYDAKVTPLLRQYCYNCHGNGKKKGDLALDTYTNATEALADRKTWERVLENLENGTMPPENKKQPAAKERVALMTWIEREVFQCDCDHPDPGRVTVRRLNRAEYNNTIRDLLGVDFKPADDFPADDAGYGFDNIGDALSMPPVLLEKYLRAAQTIVDAAIVTDEFKREDRKRYAADQLDGSAPGGPVDGGVRMLAREGDIFVNHRFPAAGEYWLRARAWGQQAGPEPARMTFSLNGTNVKTFDVTAVESAPQIYSLRVTVAAGTNRFAAAYINNYVNPKDPDPNNRDRNLLIEYLEVAGPLGEASPPPLPDTHRRLFTRAPGPHTTNEVAREIVGKFARRAYRRPVKPEELDRLMHIFDLALQGGENFPMSVSLAMQSALISPHFLFRGELQPNPDRADAVHPIDELALASRLSYFLWSSMPDEELLTLAEKGRLSRNLDAQVRRMLKDPKSAALVENFAGQWLQLRNMKLVTPDPWVYPEFDEDLRKAMQRETEMFVEAILREDRSVLDFLDSDYTFLNERLARHYGIAGVTGPEFRRVSLSKSERGGLLTQASILTVTSNPTRTSPVKRGKWVLENILGTPPPPPPPNVPLLSEKKEAILSGSLRQRMEQHRQDPSCASCHERMDGIGFGFENFNGIGGYRAVDGAFPIDPAGKLAHGEVFAGPSELKKILLKGKRKEFTRCLTEKMLTYALGRGMEYYDKCALDEIARNLEKREYRFSSLILGVVHSTPFQKRRGEGDRLAASKP